MVTGVQTCALPISWNIEFFDNETSGEKGLETYFREAIEKVVSNPPTK